MALSVRVTSVASEAVLPRIVLRDRLVEHNNTTHQQAAKAGKAQRKSERARAKKASVGSLDCGPC